MTNNRCYLQDILPENRKFVDFTQTGWVWAIDIDFDKPTLWKTKIDFKNIDVPTGATLEIKYTSILLSHDLSSASGSHF